MSERMVTTMPLPELWQGPRPLLAEWLRHLSFEELRDLLKRGPVTIAVANIGDPLIWIDPNRCFDLWKHEAKERIATPNGFRPDDYPGEYCYVASEWYCEEVGRIILLEKHH